MRIPNWFRKRAQTRQKSKTFASLDPHLAIGNPFNAQIVPLSTGNVVITSPYHLVRRRSCLSVQRVATGVLFRTLTGSTVNDLVGSGTS